MKKSLLVAIISLLPFVASAGPAVNAQPAAAPVTNPTIIIRPAGPVTNPVLIIRHGWMDGFWRLITNPMIIIKT